MATVFIHTLQERQQEEASYVQRIVNYGFLFLKFYIAYDFEIKYKIIYKGSFQEAAKKRVDLNER